MAVGDGSLFLMLRRSPWTSGTIEITGVGTGQHATVTTMGDVATGPPASMLALRAPAATRPGNPLRAGSA